MVYWRSVQPLADECKWRNTGPVISAKRKHPHRIAAMGALTAPAVMRTPAAAIDPAQCGAEIVPAEQMICADGL